jgi:hypothetical protein
MGGTTLRPRGVFDIPSEVFNRVGLISRMRWLASIDQQSKPSLSNAIRFQLPHQPHQPTEPGILTLAALMRLAVLISRTSHHWKLNPWENGSDSIYNSAVSYQFSRRPKRCYIYQFSDGLSDSSRAGGVQLDNSLYHSSSGYHKRQQKISH